MTVPPAGVMARSQDLAEIDHGDEVLCLPLARPDVQAPISLSGSALLVWRETAEPRTAEEIASRLSARFPDAEERVRDDAIRCLATFRSLGLVREAVRGT